MATLSPYLFFAGNTEEAFTFYKSVFGGDFTSLLRYKDTPEGGGVPEKEKEKLMHVSLPVGKGHSIMAADPLDSMGQLIAGNNFHLLLEAESKDEAEKLIKGLSAGGKVTMPLNDTFWGSYFGMLVDKFGIEWMVNYTHPK
jgi:PhnB protein